MNLFIMPSSQSSWVTPWIEMFQRVFHPSSAPLRAEAYISTNNGDTGWIGSDQKYQFSKHIKDMQQKPISITGEDFYVPLTVTVKDPSDSSVLKIVEFVLKKIFFFLQPKSTTMAYPYMPSILFKGAKENNTIRYYLDDHPVELTLKQQNHHLPECKKNLEECFSQLSASSENYLFNYDIPPGTLTIGSAKTLSPGAVIYNVNTGRTKVSEISEDKIEELKQFFKTDLASKSINYKIVVSNGNPDKEYILLETPGIHIENLNLLIDENYIFIYGEEEGILKIRENEERKREDLDDNILMYSKEENRRALVLKRPRMIDPYQTNLSKIEAEGAEGYIRLTLVFKSKEKTKSP